MTNNPNIGMRNEHTDLITNFEKLENFINATGATRMLLQRSYEQGFLIEGLVLYAMLVDGFCRIALVLRQQIENRSCAFNMEYIHQEDDKDFYSERAIYKLALEKNIIEKDLFNEINALYDFRNKAIHRFFICEIEYEHLGLVLDRYELVFQRLCNIVYELESEQIYKGIGMTVSGKIINEDKDRVYCDIMKKITTKDSNKLAKVLGSKLVGDVGNFSECIERERIADEISDELEIHKEKIKIPAGFTSVKEITKWAARKNLFKKCICGHEKVHHIEINNLNGKDKDLENNIKKCKVNNCKCKKYEVLDIR